MSLRQAAKATLPEVDHGPELLLQKRSTDQMCWQGNNGWRRDGRTQGGMANGLAKRIWSHSGPLVARRIRDQTVRGSNPVADTRVSA